MANKTNEELIKLIKAGTDRPDNLLQLYNQNMGVIYRYCKLYSGRVEMADLLQESFLVLAEAVDKYDLGADYSFLTLFRYVFLNHFNRVIMPEARAIKLPCNFLTLIARYKKMTRLYEQEFNKIPDDKTYCEQLKITYTDLANIRQHIGKADLLSLDFEYGDIWDNFTMMELLEDPADEIENILDAEQRRELREALDEILAKLPTNSADILRQYFFNNMDLPEYAKQKGITVQAAGKRKHNALERIRRQPENLQRLRFFVTYDDVTDFAYKPKGVKAFLSDRTSVTEAAAFHIIDMEKAKKKRAEKQTSYYDHIAAKYITGEQIAAET